MEFAPVEPGHPYQLVVCIPDGMFCRQAAVARRAVHVVPTGRECAAVVFTPASDNGAFSIRARNVGCAVAREVARGAEGGDLRYRRAGPALPRRLRRRAARADDLPLHAPRARA